MTQEQDFQKILVIKFRHLGDVLLTTPLFSILKHRYPTARIDAYVNQESVKILQGHPAIDQVIGYDRSIQQKGMFSRIKYEKKMLDQLRSYRYDLVINLTEGERGTIGAWYSGAKHRLGYRPKHKFFALLLTQYITSNPTSLHAVEQNLDALRSIGIEPKEDEKDLFFAISDIDRTVVPTQPYLLIHPSSRWTFKCWPQNKMRSLVMQLINKGYHIVITTGPGQEEKAYGDGVAAGLEVTNLCGKTNLGELGALIENAQMVLCVDSLPLHIASACKQRVLALFGPTSEVKWGPWRNPYAKVLAEALPCRPCLQAGCLGSKRSECLERLSVKSVLNALENILNSGD